MMKPIQVVVTAVFTTLALVGFASVIGWSVLPKSAEAHAVADRDQDRHGRHGGWFRGRDGDRGDRCQRFGPRHIEAARSMVAAHLDLTDAQDAELDPILDVMEAWRVDVVASCERSIDSTPEGLQVLQEVMARSAAALTEAQGSFESFYASLDDDQRATMDRWLDHHRHH